MRDCNVVPATGLRDVCSNAGSRGGVPHGEAHLRSGVCKRACGLHPDARRAAGDDHPPAGQVEAVDDLQRGGRVVPFTPDDTCAVSGTCTAATVTERCDGWPCPRSVPTAPSASAVPQRGLARDALTIPPLTISHLRVLYLA